MQNKPHLGNCHSGLRNLLVTLALKKVHLQDGWKLSLNIHEALVQCGLSSQLQSGSFTRETGGEKESCHFSHFNPPLCLYVLQAAQITSVLRTGNEQPYCLPRLTNARTPGLLILGKPATIGDGVSARRVYV